ncbi:uncharacterized protein STEHIDRAFT_125835 [Stereum hirsutum FP-91666 SS1]|uniref:uncharacterized protein n=1 Tax=Stereum hirsutum (strain FP-91666) TaxID=721885 RepID=UPI000444A32F|nr:uncharacterized protein STEHIDRAFT_125835 [Stereum hirsutum FP-91666 SS1]EIM80883.1 hypothetical protein STEHIDRAFT_125835 [Stereum hirsutum FP-91666 SS1]
MALSSRGGSPNVLQGPRIGVGPGAVNPQSQSASERAIGLAVRGPRPVGVRHGRGRSTSSLHPYVTNFRSPIDLVDTSLEATTPPYHQYVEPNLAQP